MSIIVPSHPHLRLGRTPKVLRPVLHLTDFKCLLPSRIKAALTNPTPFDYTTGLPGNMGVLGNDALGDCTAAAKYHRFQAVYFRLTGIYIAGDDLAALAVQFYAASTGFNAQAPLDDDGHNPTDQGGNMDTVADFLIKSGMPVPGGQTDRFLAAYSIDPTSDLDLSYCGSESIGVDFGVTLTTAVMPADGSPPPAIWDYDANATPVGGHDIYGLARLPSGNWKINSWGGWYEMTPRFVQQQADTAIAYVSADALKDGQTVLGRDASFWTAALASVATSV